MALAGSLFAMLLAVMFSGVLARWTRVPVPLVQVALGAAMVGGGLGALDLAPEVFFVVLLPPLLFLDGWRLPKDDLRRDAPTIATLSLGLVFFTVLGVGGFIHALLPVFPLPVAFALAAVLSPTDPIAVSAIAARTPMPLRLRRILEGESLFNDASGLVALRFAVAAAMTGAFSPGGALLQLAWVVLSGVGVGVAGTALFTALHARAGTPVGDDGAPQILGTLLLPALAYTAAEALQGSGVLAAVAAGITMSAMPHTQWQAAARIRRTAVWDVVQFAANGVVFVLLGEQLPALVAAAPTTVLATGQANPWWLVGWVLLIVAMLLLLRHAWAWVSLRVAYRLGMGGVARLPAAHGRLVMAMSVAGVRGAVTLAGVLTLPQSLPDGSPFPGRELAITLAAGVVVTSLLMATLLLPPLLRGLVLPAAGAHDDAERRARVAAAESAVQAVLTAAAALPAAARERDLAQAAAARVAARYRERLALFAADAAGDPPTGTLTDLERPWLRHALRAEREALVTTATALGVKDIVLRRLVREVDLQEAQLGP
jgi:CPA1 family monovalent cation:H+ antiporter